MSITAADLMDDLTDAIGENAEAKGVTGWLDTHLPELNYALSGDLKGGFPQGRLIEIFGEASSGKTFIATLAMRAVQERDGLAFFADHERSFSPSFAEELGLNTTDLNHFRHLKPRTFEDSMEAFKRAVPMMRDKGYTKPMIWVFDSVAAMVPRARLLDDKGNDKISADVRMNESLALAKCCSQNYPILKMYAEDYNCTVLMLNQIRLNPGMMFGDPRSTPGGKAPEFYADIRLSLGKSDIKTKDKEKEVIGFEVTAKTTKNKITRPHRQAKWKVMFDDIMGVKIDMIATNLDYALRIGAIVSEGNRVLWEGKKVYASTVITELEADPDGNKKLLEMIYKSGEKAVEGS